jgi:flagellar hook-basal body complex protein FliE
MDAIGPALRAYGATAARAATPGQASGADGFEAAIGRAMDQATQASRSAEDTTRAALVGHAGTTDVVMAVTRAELALQTAVALRDRVVAAYQDVMRMSI